VLDNLKTDKAFGNAKELMSKAKAVMIVPGLVKGGFFVGGEGGDGVLMKRNTAGWSDPAFFSIGSASFGLQIGLQKSEVMLFIMSDKALEALLKNEVKLGAQAGVSVVTLGGAAQAAVTSNGGADIIAWSSSTGAYGGLTLEGSVIKARDTYNQSYYKTISVHSILAKAAHDKATERLRSQMGALSG
jgi:lipid-binding SYLF domain-containing protein